ncbi:uncharacterized protein B0I36DRAFT_299993 [Microdochium trichocladiopsis]|uniref:BTB domain-containing protein n=1 Tax=Microdochium trichocladiopsis TaxID=1682393 RepID=A0A9P8XQF4_9PEZI|nr:uncharacterized protein B0I36DRAFT_299993 [Microdochium trichocladiopsis]KAH7012085.1 hypothetical protein B0I36DRAFT_299993 [Microdochium trichocladiopsis]
MMVSPQRELYAAIAGLHLNKLYSDLTIASTTKEYAVHRAIICTRSEFFAGWCRSRFKEVDAGILSLPDDDPSVVDAMIRYFYHLDYDVPVKRPQGQGDTRLLFNAKMYTLADKYLIHGLKDLAVSKFKSASSKHETVDIQDFLDATQVAYSYTNENDRVLREAVLETFVNHKVLLDKEETQDMLKETDMLAYDVLLYFRQRRSIG